MKISLAVVAAVAVLVAGLLFTLSAARSTGDRDAARAHTAQQMLIAQLDCETGLRGFLLTEQDAFLKPFRSGTVDLARVFVQARSQLGGVRGARGPLADQMRLAAQWQVAALQSIERVRVSPFQRPTGASLVQRRLLMDRFRAANAAYSDAVDVQRNSDIATSSRTTTAVVAALALLLSLGGIAVGRAQNRTARRRSDAARAADREQNELRASREQALETSRLKSEFVANMSHEIRTPLNGVVCMSELMLGTSLTEEQREYADVVLTSADALMRVIDDILDFSKIEAGKLDIVDEDFSIETVAADVCDMLGMRASEKGIELAVAVDPGVPSVVRGDGNRVRQVLINLVGNAIKFTPDGEIIVRVGLARGGDGAELLRVEVTDTGIGIEPDRLAVLFEPFCQADATTTRRYGGTGLGLSISKHLAEMMGGEIAVRSTPGAGSTFWFTLPCVRGTTAQIGGPVRDLTGIRVLVVDDNASSRQIIERELASWGMIPDSAGDGRSALELMHRAADAGRPHEAAVIDMGMPEMDGLELAQTIRSIPRLRGARLILLSGTQVLARDAKAAGIDAVLTKPVRQSTLCNQLVNSLNRAPKPDQLTSPEHTNLVSIGDGTRLLVAEDNEINRITARRLLQKFGFVVDIARDGREAIEQTLRVEYAAVFMDCQMPGIDGYEATSAIRRREGDRRHTPIIAMTAGTMKGDREKCFASGMDDYISKPIRAATLHHVLDHMFANDEPLSERDQTAAANRTSSA